MDNAKQFFTNTPLGGKIILVSTVVAIFSLFLDWVDVGFISQNGMQQQGYIMLLFFIYPVFLVMKNKKGIRILNILSGVLVVVFMFLFMEDKKADFYGEVLNANAAGIYLFFICTIGLTVGAFLWKKREDEVVVEEV